MFVFLIFIESSPVEMFGQNECQMLTFSYDSMWYIDSHQLYALEMLRTHFFKRKKEKESLYGD